MVERLKKILVRMDGDNRCRHHRVMIGFDGFIDKLVHPVKSLQDDGHMEYFENIGEFGDFISGKSNRSCCIEIRPVMKKIGGNAPITGRALAVLGIPTKCIGAFGYPEMETMFQEKTENLEMISIANPGRCTALEFEDGKVMLSESHEIRELNYTTLKSRLKEEKILEIVQLSDVIALMNWSETLECESIWEGLLDDILPKVSHAEEKKIFIDISDCSNRSRKDISGLAEMVERFSGLCRVYMSLNRNEFEQFSRKLDYHGEMEERMRQLKEKCGLSALVIHDTDGAYIMEQETMVFWENKYNSNPKILTGGGDHFNAGMIYGLVMEMDLNEAVIIGNAVSGYYVTYAESPNPEQLKKFIEQWFKKLEKANV